MNVQMPSVGDIGGVVDIGIFIACRIAAAVVQYYIASRYLYIFVEGSCFWDDVRSYMALATVEGVWRAETAGRGAAARE